jgi:branched-chain amino acid transport system permease protein
MQIVINIIYSSFLYLIISLSFSIIYSVSKFFHLAHAVAITFGAYIAYYFSVSLNLPIIVSIGISIFFSIISILIICNFLYLPLLNKKVPPFMILIASLGIYIILENLLAFIAGNDVKTFNSIVNSYSYNVFDSYITNFHILTILTGIIAIVISNILTKYSLLGKKIRAIASNEKLSNIFGINSNKIILWSFLYGTALASIAGILVSFDTGLTPTMGFNLLLYGVVAMIIGGAGSTWGLIGGSLLLATAQHLGAYYIDSKWMDTIAYIILILFLIWKPLGFSGKELKKVEV